MFFFYIKKKGLDVPGVGVLVGEPRLVLEEERVLDNQLADIGDSDENPVLEELHDIDYGEHPGVLEDGVDVQPQARHLDVREQVYLQDGGTDENIIIHLYK